MANRSSGTSSRRRSPPSPATRARGENVRRVGPSADPRLRDVKEAGLFRLLAPYVARENRNLVVGFGDDTAVWDSAPGDPRAPLLLVTTDTMIEGTHFRTDWSSWEEVGRKLVAMNVSDIGAMGGRATLAVISLACPAAHRIADIESLYSGLRMECARWGVMLAGGDSVRSSQVALTLTLLGEKPKSSAPALRSGLRGGQTVYVTGWPGESGAGLALLQDGDRAGGKPRVSAGLRRDGAFAELLRARHCAPTPRPEIGAALAAAFPDLAMMDVSDGIDHEVRAMAEASRARVAIAPDRLPVSAALRWAGRHFDRDPRGWVLFGGEDYELVFATAAPEDAVRRVVRAAARRGKAPADVHRIGHVLRQGRGVAGTVEYQNPNGGPSGVPQGITFEHFE